MYVEQECSDIALSSLINKRFIRANEDRVDLPAIDISKKGQQALLHPTNLVATLVNKQDFRRLVRSLFSHFHHTNDLYIPDTGPEFFLIARTVCPAAA